MAPRGGRKVIIVKKKGAGHGGHHGGSWKVAYADFVTAMMAFFMVMWIVNLKPDTKEAIESYFTNPVGFTQGYAAGSRPLSKGTTPTNIKRVPLRMVVRDTEQRTFQQLQQAILEKLAQNDSLKALNAVVDVQITKEGLRIELVEADRGDAYFPLGSARMRPVTVLVLQLVGTELATLQHPVILEGHTDATKFGTDASYGNWELSGDRANAARRVLETVGVLDNRIIEVRGYAATMPRVPSDRFAPANRRISVLLPFSVPPDGASDAASMAQFKTDSMRAYIAKRVP